MREIKFRAWDGERMHHLGMRLDGFTGVLSQFNNNTLMQYTGLKDKNGVEIYEGDIVTILHSAWTERCEVIFDRGSFTLRQLRFIDGKQSLVRMSAIELWPESNQWKLEVIGNIYENSELLKKSD